MEKGQHQHIGNLDEKESDQEVYKGEQKLTNSKKLSKDSNRLVISLVSQGKHDVKIEVIADENVLDLRNKFSLSKV